MTNISTEAASRRESARSSNGTFGHQQHGESAVALAPAYVDVEPGDSHDFGHGDDPRVSHYSITADDETGEKTAVMVFEEDFRFAVPDAVGDDAEAGQEYLNDRWPVIERALRERYPTDDSQGLDIDASGETVRLEFYRRMGTDQVTEEQAADAAWNHTDGVKFLNESDPGTYGAEDLNRILRQRLEAYDEAVAEGVPERLAVEGYTTVLAQHSGPVTSGVDYVDVVNDLGITGASYEEDGSPAQHGRTHRIRLTRTDEIGKLREYDTTEFVGWDRAPSSASDALANDLADARAQGASDVGLPDRLTAFLGEDAYRRAGGI